MSEKLDAAVSDLVDKFGCEMETFRDETRVFVSPEDIVAAATLLRDEHDFEMLADLTAVDYWPQMEPRYHVVYQLRSIRHNLIVTLRVPISGSDEQLDTLTGVYNNANWHERELFDMFGLQINGHPDLRRILMPHDWEGHPLRKDYPLGYEEVQFTFNMDEIDSKKNYPKE